MILNRKLIKQASARLKGKLLKSDLSSIPSNNFTGYLSNYIKMYDIIIQRYEKILLKTCSNKILNNIRFLDFGGGTGILALLAKECGVGSVAYYDLSAEYTESFKILCKLIDANIDKICCANYKNVHDLDYYDIIANYDVLEHLDKPLNAFISLAKHLRLNGLIYMVSGANTYNPLLQIMNKIKHYDYEPINNTNKLYIARKKYITKNHEDFSEELCKHLAYKTRGLTYENIDAYITLFMIIGNDVDVNINSNTCNPENGYWQEHCFKFFQFKNMLKKQFNNACLNAEYFPVSKPKIEFPFKQKNKSLIYYYIFSRFVSLLLAPLLNSLIFIMPGRLKFLFAPAYSIEIKRFE